MNFYIYPDKTADSSGENLILIILIAWPFAFEVIQMCKFGFINYWTDLSNYMDFSFIAGSGVMAILHTIPGIGPRSFVGRFFMVFVILCSIRRTFNFLRIFSFFCTLVTMMNNVVWSLKIFLTFFFILQFLFALMYAVLGIGNLKIPGDYKKAFGESPADAPNFSYSLIGM